MSAAPDPFRILAVCTGNVCRSPAIEMMLRHGLSGVPDVVVASAGTRALIGKPIEPKMAEVLREGGLLIDGFTARQLTAPALEMADLVLCASRLHRSEAVTMWPAAVQKVFTIREFARLAAGITPQEPEGETSPTPGECLRLALPQLRLQRGMRRAARPEDDDVPDPYGRSSRHHQRAVDDMMPGVEALLALV